MQNLQDENKPRIKPIIKLTITPSVFVQIQMIYAKSSPRMFKHFRMLHI